MNKSLTELLSHNIHNSLDNIYKEVLMNKSCKTCRHIVVTCQKCKEFDKWEAKMERIQITEEQARELLNQICVYDGKYEMDISYRNWKDRGYIKKSILEEAEEMFSEYKSKTQYPFCRDDLIYKQHEAIIYLKEQLKR